PRFRIITGISTGALQSTFAFLERTPQIVKEYSIKQEEQLLLPYTKGGLKSRSKLKQLRAAYNLVDKGAVAELEPLRTRLNELINDELLRAVAAEAGQAGTTEARKLLIGAVEMDTGDAYIFDLTKAAQFYVAGNKAMRDCYIEALMASSSVPIGALPVFIEGQMFIDGGARFGVISDFTGAIFNRVAMALPAHQKKNLFVLVNGTLEASKTCHLKDCSEHPIPPTQPGLVPQHGSWSFDKLALRSVSILINQSYRSSVYWATTSAKDLNFTPYFVRIEPDHLKHEVTLNFDVPAGETLNCGDWKERDISRDQPTEFHPRFMRCLIDYGHQRKEIAKWVEAE
ncbi:MAG: patatin-like phospholipase family protein, partial [Blastomonas fulva]|uniref:patatin-like phospholipase family protein n=1 Tax=Blastomonas fulva TaxID=1550728 RepID=UPI004034F028